MRKDTYYGVDQGIHNCRCCHTPLQFEIQLLPSLLHVLDVDKYVDSQNNRENTSLASEYQEGGMNWGNIAIYTCPHGCVNTDTYEEFCVVQDSVDEVPLLPSSSRMIYSGRTNDHTSTHTSPQLDDDLKTTIDDDDDDDDDDGDNDNKVTSNYLETIDGMTYKDDDEDW
jgi:Programmed cell death protein 2, C-terminal putative domain